MARILLLAGMIVLGACAQLSRTPEAPGSFTVSYSPPSSVDGPVSTTGADEWLRKDATAACPKGFDVLDEVVVPGNPPTVTWRVRCL